MAMAARREVVLGLPPEVHVLQPLQLCLWKAQGDKAPEAAGLRNPLGSVTGFPQNSTRCSFHLSLQPASITLFNTGDLQSCPKLPFPCPASLRHSWRRGGSGKMDLKATNNEQQREKRGAGNQQSAWVVGWGVWVVLCPPVTSGRSLTCPVLHLL